MDNRIFNVNGAGKEMLADTLRLALWQQRGGYADQRGGKAEGYMVSPTHGLILMWHVSPTNGGHKFIAPLGAEPLAEMIMEWLKTEEARSIALGDWEEDIDQDGHNSKGWRVYCEDWGHVDGNHYAIVAVKPVYLWHGK